MRARSRSKECEGKGYRPRVRGMWEPGSRSWSRGMWGYMGQGWGGRLRVRVYRLRVRSIGQWCVKVTRVLRVPVAKNTPGLHVPTSRDWQFCPKGAKSWNQMNFQTLLALLVWIFGPKWHYIAFMTTCWPTKPIWLGCQKKKLAALLRPPPLWSAERCNDFVQHAGYSSLLSCLQLSNISIPVSFTVSPHGFKHCSIESASHSSRLWKYYNCTPMPSHFLSSSTTFLPSHSFFSCSEATPPLASFAILVMSMGIFPLIIK